MFRVLVAAATAAVVVSGAAPAFAENVLYGVAVSNVATRNDTFGGAENSGAPPSPSAFAEVGRYTYVEQIDADVFNRTQTRLTGLVTVYGVADEAPPPDEPPPAPVPHYLTFDIAQQGGVHAAGPYNESNVGRPFTGQIRISYGRLVPFTFDDIDGPVSPLATFDISPDWADVGESFSFDISDAYDLMLPFGAEVVFFLEAVGQSPLENTAWTFGNFRLTQTDQTTAAPGGVVPEPSTWALMIGGFGLAGAALRRWRVRAIA